MSSVTGPVMTKEQREMQKKLDLTAFLNMAEASSYVIDRIIATKQVDFDGKLKLNRIKKANNHFLKGFGRNISNDEEDFLSAKAAMVFEFAQGVNFIPNDEIENFSKDFEILFNQYVNQQS